METVSIKKSRLYLLAAVIAAASFAALISFNGNNDSNEVTEGEVLTLEGRFAALSNVHTNSCSGPGFIDAKGDDERLQGSCCSAMDLHRYEEQVEGLKKYAEFEAIPSDPYDIPVPVASMLLDYQRTISLTEEQQRVYDEATKLSHEGGPCCCKCWRWYAFEGLARHLIVEEGFTAEQVAEVWDLEDGCGGKGHAHSGA